MANQTPTLRTGRTTTFIVSILTVVMMAVLGVGQFLGLSTGMTLTLIESIGLILGGSALLAEIYLEGNMTGVFSRREWTGLDLFGTLAGTGVLFIGLAGLVGALTETSLVGMPASVKGMVFMFNAILLSRELFTE